ncbi:NADH-quinone oxidoreductase subunit L [Candidatus Omnitrophota bacterium]
MILNPAYFRFDKLSIFVGMVVVFFSLLIALYSIGFMRGKKGLLRYYLYMLLTVVASLGAIFANNLLLFIVFWGFLGLLLYLLIGFGEGDNTSYTAKKTLIIIGGTDALMLLGLAIVWKTTGLLQMSRISLQFTDNSIYLAYICLAIGAFAKAGAMPFHTWVPDVAQDAPVPVSAFLPASLDKLLGIYFLARLSLDIFVMDKTMNMFLMILGAFTIVAAVMMALIQHDFKKLLGYHAVSQVGYMILGIGTGTPIGIAGGLFHMLNNAIYKSCLFLSGGIVEKEAKTTELDKLGGLVKFLPVTFIAFLIASFAISGVPPFNGFASKWMVYQGIIETAKGGGFAWIIFLVAAMFGSALTMASFMKLVHAIFLGQPSQETSKLKKRDDAEPVLLLVPVITLTILCVIFGVFAYQIPLKMFILPSIGGTVVFKGLWSSGAATIMMIVGVGIGFLIYLLGTFTKTREVDVFIGGENLDNHPDMRVSGTEFYNTIQEIGILKFIYMLAKNKVFDIYEVGAKLTFGLNKVLRYLHNGVLSSYLSWCLLGMAVLFYFLLR